MLRSFYYFDGWGRWVILSLAESRKHRAVENAAGLIVQPLCA